MYEGLWWGELENRLYSIAPLRDIQYSFGRCTQLFLRDHACEARNLTNELILASTSVRITSSNSASIAYSSTRHLKLLAILRPIMLKDHPYMSSFLELPLHHQKK